MLALTGKMREELWEEPGAKDEWLVPLPVSWGQTLCAVG